MARRCKACNGLDPATPKKEPGYTFCDCAQNPKLYRRVAVSVVVGRNWLTDDGNMSEEEGWKTMQEEIERALQSRPYQLTRTDYKLSFEEWDADAEPEPATVWGLQSAGAQGEEDGTATE